MENINEYMGLIVALVVVTIVVILQITSFIKTRLRISELGTLFDKVGNLFLKETSLTPSVLSSKSSLQKFLSNIPNRHVKSEDGEGQLCKQRHILWCRNRYCL